MTEQTRQSIEDYLRAASKKPGDFLFHGHRGSDQGMTTRQYARLVAEWVASIGLDPHLFGTHSLRRTKATLIYRRTGNLRAVQLLLGHTKIESTVRYLGIEVDDALAIAEQVDWLIEMRAARGPLRAPFGSPPSDHLGPVQSWIILAAVVQIRSGVMRKCDSSGFE